MHHQGKRHFAHAVAVRSFVFVIGTRPEVIKVAPIIRRLSETNWASVRIVTTGQQSDRRPDFQLTAHRHPVLSQSARGADCQAGGGAYIGACLTG